MLIFFICLINIFIYVKYISKVDMVYIPEKNAVLTAIYLGILMYITIMFFYNFIVRSMMDSNWYRLILILCTPIFWFWMMFGAQYLVYGFSNAFGPIKSVKRNSKYYSQEEPVIADEWNNWPKLTIQMPVYKEDFEKIIKPTLQSVYKMLENYKGEWNVFINDDGLSVINDDDRINRTQWYQDQPNLLYVGRPSSGRAGRFKKASNMNYCLNFVLTHQDQTSVYEQAFEEIPVEVTYNYGTMDIGNIILLIDSDTRLPIDISSAVYEMVNEPRIGFLQCSTSPMIDPQIKYTDFQRAFHHFTNIIYHIALVFSSSGGDPAALVGHNVLLNWDAIKLINSDKKFWSENHVSEDFHMSLMLQTNNYIGKYITYLKGFEEGTSLCVLDEIIRFKKYAFGSSELLFNNIHKWSTKGLLSPLFKKYISTSSIPWYCKVNMVAYLGTYFAMASSPIGTLFNFFIYSYVSDWQKDTVSSIDICVQVLLLFSLYGPITTGIMQFRLGRKGIIQGIFDEVRWWIIFTFFFSGLGYYLMISIGCHLLDLKMVWGSTNKEIEDKTFKQEVMDTLNISGYPILMGIVMLLIIVIFFFIPEPYGITNPYSIAPLGMCAVGHILSPLVLNPTIMRFIY